MKYLYDSVGLTPYRAAFLHLILIGIPLRFGLLPMGWGRGWLLPKSILPEPCTIFDTTGECSDSELFSLRDTGVRYILCYELGWIVWFVIRKTKENVISFHYLLLASSTTTLVLMAWLQNYFHPTPTISEFNPDFFTDMIFYHSVAVALSLWTVFTHPRIYVDSMKWSIPANAIFLGAVVNLFIATASFQVLLEKPGVEQYFVSHQSVTPTVKLCFFLGAFLTMAHAILLLRIRTFLNVKQLRAVCLYKVILNLALPLFWFPELSKKIMHIDHRIPFTLRIVLTLIYMFGYLWAGKAEGFSRILTSEKDQ